MSQSSYTYAAWAADAGDYNADDKYESGDNNAGENAAGEEDVGDNNAGENAAGDNNAVDNPLATTPLATITRQYRELRRELCNQSARIQLLEDITRGGGGNQFLQPSKTVIDGIVLTLARDLRREISVERFAPKDCRRGISVETFPSRSLSRDLRQELCVERSPSGCEHDELSRPPMDAV